MAAAISSRQAAGNRRSWPIQSKQQSLFRSRNWFEAEDAVTIPESFIVKPADLHKPHRVSLMQIMKVIQKVGEDPLTVGRGMQYLTINDRHHSFQGSWMGPPANLMAECGLYKMTEDSATCYSCGITLRSLTPATCVWTTHRQFAPYCRHLQRAKSCNPTHLEGGQERYVRHLSADDAEDSGIRVSRR